MPDVLITYWKEIVVTQTNLAPKRAEHEEKINFIMLILAESWLCAKRRNQLLLSVRRWYFHPTRLPRRSIKLFEGFHRKLRHAREDNWVSCSFSLCLIHRNSQTEPFSLSPAQAQHMKEEKLIRLRFAETKKKRRRNRSRGKMCWNSFGCWVISHLLRLPLAKGEASCIWNQ